MMHFHLLLALLAMATSLLGLHGEIANSGPLVYHSWPPTSRGHLAKLKPQFQANPHRHMHRTANLGGGALLYRRYPSSPSSASAADPSGPAASGSLLQSSSSLYSPQKIRAPQSLLQQQQQQQLQHQQHLHNRLIRPQMLKMSSPSHAQHYMKTSAKPMHYPFSGQQQQQLQQQQQHRQRPANPMLMVTTTAGTSFHAKPNKPAASSPAKKRHPIVDYVFEKPSLQQLQQPQHQQPQQQQQPLILSSTLVPSYVTGRPLEPPNLPPSVQHGTKYNPIHTIQAPNLSLHEQKQFAHLLSSPLEGNQLFERDSMFPTHLAFTMDRPSSIAQYQVTESTNDHAIRNVLPVQNPLLFLADPNQQFGQLPAGHPQPQPQQQHPQQPQLAFTAAGNQPAASALVAHLAHHQQLLPNHLPSYTNTMPMAAYNPTYLVTQSNQLLSQHKQHLFKPDHGSHYNVQQPAAIRHQPQSHPPTANNVYESEFLPSFQLPSGDYVPLTDSVQTHPTHTSYHYRTNHSAAVSAAPIQHHHHQSLSAALSVQEVSNLLNFGQLHEPVTTEPTPPQTEADAGFVASSFQFAGDAAAPTTAALVGHRSPQLVAGGFEDSIYRHQQHNDDRIQEATRLAMQQQQRAEAEAQQIFVTRSPELRASEAEADAAHQRHQQRLAEHQQQQQQQQQLMASNMRIYVPDEDYPAEQSDTFHKRSDGDAGKLLRGGGGGDLEAAASNNAVQPEVTTAVSGVKEVQEEETSSGTELEAITGTTEISLAAIDQSRNAIVVGDPEEEMTTTATESVGSN